MRDAEKGIYRVRVRSKTSQSHQFLQVRGTDLTKVACPQGWMSPEGYDRYLKVTLRKMREREKKARR